MRTLLQVLAFLVLISISVAQAQERDLVPPLYCDVVTIDGGLFSKPTPYKESIALTVTKLKEGVKVTANSKTKDFGTVFFEKNEYVKYARDYSKDNFIQFVQVTDYNGFGGFRSTVQTESFDLDRNDGEMKYRVYSVFYGILWESMGKCQAVGRKF